MTRLALPTERVSKMRRRAVRSSLGQAARSGLRATPLKEAPPAQFKLKIGRVDDPLEKEADRAADRVMRMPASNAAAPVVQRKCAECAAAEDNAVQMKKSPGVPQLEQTPVLDFARGLQRARAGGGSRFDTGTLGFMESRFGHDFGSVRLHTGPQADALNRGVQARAFTTGRDVFFRAGEYRPYSSDGRRLIAHELAHVVQQGEGARSGAVVQREILEDVAGSLASLAGRGLHALADEIVSREAGSNPVVATLDELRKAALARTEPVSLPLPDARRLLVLLDSIIPRLPSWVPIPTFAPLRAPLAAPGVAVVALPVAIPAALIALMIALIMVALAFILARAVLELVELIRRALLRRAPAPAPAPPPAPTTKAPPRPAPRPEPKLEPRTPKPDETVDPVPIPQCRIVPLGRHLGGNKRSDKCADDIPPNVFKGSDAKVITPTGRTKNFDALSPPGELWEVKTGAERGGDFSSNPPFVQRIQIADDLKDMREESSIAFECGRPFVFAVSDALRLSILKPQVPRGVLLKQIACAPLP
jgi:hypothetical protein